MNVLISKEYMEKISIFFYTSKVGAKPSVPKKVLKLQRKINLQKKNVFDNNYQQNETATHL